MKSKCKGQFIKKMDVFGKETKFCELCGMVNSHVRLFKPTTIKMSDRSYDVDTHGTFRRRRR